MKKVNKKEGTFAIVAAIIVLFSAMWNPWISVVVSLFALISFAVWEFVNKNEKQR